MTPESNASPVWLTQEAFSQACDALPLISIDLYLVRTGSSGLEILLGLRKNRPAQGWWFSPGGRVKKNESHSHALQRIASEEVGLSPGTLNQARWLGIWDHFYPDSAFDPNVSTHYINMAYLLPLDDGQAQELQRVLDKCPQHHAWEWMSLTFAQAHPVVHPNVKATLQAIASLSINNPIFYA